MTYLGVALAVGYVAIIVECGWWGVLMIGCHAAILLVASNTKR